MESVATNLIDSTDRQLIERTRAMTIERIKYDSGNVRLRVRWVELGTDAMKAICDRAGITFAHFKHVAANRRRFSREAAAVFSKETGLTLEDLMPLKIAEPRRQVKKPKRGTLIAKTAKKRAKAKR